jgi:hypothetical protein
MSLHFIEKAYAAGTPISANNLINNILDNIVNPIILLMLALAVIFFLWGVLDFVRNAENSEKRKEGGTHMLWGAIGLFIMISAYGIVRLIIGTITNS